MSTPSGRAGSDSLRANRTDPVFSGTSMIRGYADHAANERTFVARTVIAVIAFGFGQAKFNIFAARVTSAALGNSEQSLEFAHIHIRRSVPSSRLLVPQFSAYGSPGPLGCSTILGGATRRAYAAAATGVRRMLRRYHTR